jgi:hypothetical protein
MTIQKVLMQNVSAIALFLGLACVVGSISPMTTAHQPITTSHAATF